MKRNSKFCSPEYDKYLFFAFDDYSEENIVQVSGITLIDESFDISPDHTLPKIFISDDNIKEEIFIEEFNNKETFMNNELFSFLVFEDQDSSENEKLGGAYYKREKCYRTLILNIRNPKFLKFISDINERKINNSQGPHKSNFIDWNPGEIDISLEMPIDFVFNLEQEDTIYRDTQSIKRISLPLDVIKEIIALETDISIELYKRINRKIQYYENTINSLKYSFANISSEFKLLAELE